MPASIISSVTSISGLSRGSVFVIFILLSQVHTSPNNDEPLLDQRGSQFDRYLSRSELLERDRLLKSIAEVAPHGFVYCTFELSAAPKDHHRRYGATILIADGKGGAYPFSDPKHIDWAKERVRMDIMQATIVRYALSNPPLPEPHRDFRSYKGTLPLVQVKALNL